MIVASPDFETWYDSLSEADAEAVSAAVDVLAELGAGLGPPRSSELLLWFDGLASGSALGGAEALAHWLEPGPRVRSLERVLHVAARSRELTELLGWARRSLSLFESERFRSRLKRLDSEAVDSALRGVERVRSRLGAARQRLALGDFSESSLHELGRLVDEALSAAGLQSEDPALHAAGLRELRVELGERPARVIYGIDPSAGRVLLISGELLDRAYYGDSVRAAEKRWDEYLRSEYMDSAGTAER